SKLCRCSSSQSKAAWMAWCSMSGNRLVALRRENLGAELVEDIVVRQGAAVELERPEPVHHADGGEPGQTSLGRNPEKGTARWRSVAWSVRRGLQAPRAGCLRALRVAQGDRVAVGATVHLRAPRGALRGAVDPPAARRRVGDDVLAARQDRLPAGRAAR